MDENNERLGSIFNELQNKWFIKNYSKINVTTKVLLYLFLILNIILINRLSTLWMKLVFMCIFGTLIFLDFSNKLIKNRIEIKYITKIYFSERIYPQIYPIKSPLRIVAKIHRKDINQRLSSDSLLYLVPFIIFSSLLFMIQNVTHTWFFLLITKPLAVRIVILILFSLYIITNLYLIFSYDLKLWYFNFTNYNKVILSYGYFIVYFESIFFSIAFHGIEGISYAYLLNIIVASMLCWIIIIPILLTQNKKQKEEETECAHIQNDLMICFEVFRNILTENHLLPLAIHKEFKGRKFSKEQIKENNYLIYTMNPRFDKIFTFIFFDDIIDSLSKKKNNDKIDSIIKNKQDVLKDNSIKESILNFAQGMIYLNQKKYDSAKKKIGVALELWNKTKSPRIKIWSNVFQHYITYIDALLTKNPEMQTLCFKEIANLHKQIDKNLHSIDDRSYLKFASYYLLYLSRKSHTGTDKRSLRKYEKLIDKLYWKLSENEEKLYLFFDNVLKAIKNYTRAGYVPNELKDYWNYAKENIVEADKYILKVNSILGDSIMPANTFKKIQNQIVEEKPVRKSRNTLDNILSAFVTLYLIPLLLELFKDKIPNYNPWIRNGILIGLSIIILLYYIYKIIKYIRS